jgi:hypothetical protein
MDIKLFIAAWLFFGMTTASAVRIGAGAPARYRRQALYFYLAIVLAGPLNMLVALMPDSMVKELSRQVREKWDTP